MIQDYFGKVPFQREINLDEAVVHGAAIQAEIIASATGATNCPLVDVSRLSLGIETDGGMFSRMIQQNSVLPLRRSYKYVSFHPPQTSTLLFLKTNDEHIASLPQ
jgi:molecular chaperone DnaK (HSP70)